jgi:hypothetical protein
VLRAASSSTMPSTKIADFATQREHFVMSKTLRYPLRFWPGIRQARISGLSFGNGQAEKPAPHNPAKPTSPVPSISKLDGSGTRLGGPTQTIQLDSVMFTMFA